MGRLRGEDKVNRVCWSYSKVEEPSFPKVEVVIHVPELEVRLPKKGGLETKVDTGYPGFLMLPTELYEEASLQLTELPEEKFGVYRTAAGLIEVKRAKALVEIVKADLREELIVETPRYYKFDRALLGRSFLRRFTFLLHGPKAEGCLLL
jgi:predicted aspartyl protease